MWPLVVACTSANSIVHCSGSARQCTRAISCKVRQNTTLHHVPSLHHGSNIHGVGDVQLLQRGKRRGEQDAPRTSINVLMHGTRTQLALHNFFLGDKKFHATPIKRSTISAETKRLLVRCGATPPGSPLQAEHIRHTALSQVEAHDPERLPEAIGRARNSYKTFEGKYRTAIAPEQFTLMKKLPKRSQLELIMLG